jgi:hypothetical protein
MRKKAGRAIAVLCAVLAMSGASFAGEVDVLVNKLVDKGVLTPLEAQIVLDETKNEVAKEVAQGKSTVLPAWVQKMKVKGDLRLRYQWNKRKASEERHRGRYRFRLGVETKVVDQLKVGFGLATGGDDPRSTNQTMANTFDTPDIRLDYAFAEYEATPWLTLTGGKFPRKPVLWQPSDLLWDSDINPEGGAAVIQKSLGSDVDGFLNTGLFVLDEASSDTSDPLMAFVQSGLKWKVSDGVSLKAAVAYYGFDGIKGASLDNAAGTNSADSAGNLMYGYNAVNPSMELGFKEPFDGLVPYAALFGDYVYNADPDDHNQGYLIGLKFGDKSVKKKGQWQFKYLYRRLERDAWLDTFPDSDSYDGGTDVKGHEVIFQYALNKNVVLGFDYYFTERILSSARPENLLQVDLQLKF